MKVQWPVIAILLLFFMIGISPAGYSHFELEFSWLKVTNFIIFISFFFTTIFIYYTPRSIHLYMVLFLYLILTLSHNFGLIENIGIIGAHNVTSLFVIFALSLFRLLNIYLPKSARIFIFCLFVLMIIFRPIDQVINTKIRINTLVQRGLNNVHSDSQCALTNSACQFTAWLLNRKNLDAYRAAGKPYPVFFVAASGGGIYAASHTFHFLNAASALCKEFTQHLFTISAVSGGSFGTLPFIDSSNEIKPMQNIGCSSTKVLQNDAFSKDHLGAVIAGYIFGNIPHFFIPFFKYKTSVNMLEYSFELALSEKNISKNVSESWDTHKNIPAIIFNITEGGTGIPKIISPIKLNNGFFGLSYYTNIFSDFSINENKGVDVSLLTAASLSARFPFLTPPGKVVHSDYRTTTYLFDGGYFDNTGLSALGLLYRSIKTYSEHRDYEITHSIRSKYSVPILNAEEGQCEIYKTNEKKENNCYQKVYQSGDIPIDIHIIAITNDDLENNITSSHFFSPINQFYISRQSKTNHFIENFIKNDIGCGAALCEDSYNGLIENNVPAGDNGFPLSWTLGTSMDRKMRDYMGTADQCQALREIEITDMEVYDGSYSSSCQLQFIKEILLGKDKYYAYQQYGIGAF